MNTRPRRPWTRGRMLCGLGLLLGVSALSPSTAAHAVPTGAVVVTPTATRSAATPPALILVIPALLALLVVFGTRRRAPGRPTAAATVPSRPLVRAALALAVIALATLPGEVVAYKLGLIAIVFVAALGLHVLVNGAGELSLVHAGLIGLPAFVVAQLAAHSRASPVLMLPAGVVVGGVLGLAIAVPALRAKGLQVAVVTLAFGIAIDQFLFIRSWVVGPPGGLQLPEPSLLGLHFSTSRSLVPVAAVTVIGAAVAARQILGSKIGRALSFIRANPEAAAAAGIPVASYRLAAYGIAGSFAGLAGWLYVVWVQQVSPKAFPLTLSFTYLVIAVLAGRGGFGGVALSAVFVEGGQLFGQQLFSHLGASVVLYAAPILLIYNVTRYEKGINGALGDLTTSIRTRRNASKRRWVMTPTGDNRQPGATIRLGLLGAVVALVLGFSAIALAWYHAGNTDQIWIQNQEMISGGFGGLGLIVLGAALLIRDVILTGRASHADPSTADPSPPDPAASQPPAPAQSEWPQDASSNGRRLAPVARRRGGRR